MLWKVLHFLLSKCDFSRVFHTDRSWHVFVIATVWSGKTMVSVLQANLIGCRVGFVLSCFFKSKFSCSLLWRERGPFHWALTLSINTRVVDWAAIEPKRTESQVTSRKFKNSEVGSQKWEVGNQKWEVGSGKSEVGNRSRKSEVGSRKWEVGGPKV